MFIRINAWRLVCMLMLFIGGSGLATAATLQPGPLVDVNWLGQHLDTDNLVVVDVRDDDADSEDSLFAAGHIPGAVHAGYGSGGWRIERDGIVGQLPPVADLEIRIGQMGISNNDTVVIVPAGAGPNDFAGAARVYWTFKVLGHDKVSILNGGYRAWVAAGKNVATGEQDKPWPAEFTADFQPQLLASKAQVEQQRGHGLQMLDARPGDYFAGSKKSSWASRAGTIPGALNLPQQQFMTQTDSADGDGAWFFDAQKAVALVQQSALNTAEPVATFCNTGTLGATDWFALAEVVGMQQVRLYDGGMVAWTADEDAPVQVTQAGKTRVLGPDEQ